MSQTIDQVYRDYNTQGVPASGEHEPDKREIRALLKMIQNSGGQAVTRNTLSALNGVTPPTENYMGVVLADPNPANNGYYSRSGGAWVFGRGFSDTFTVLNVTGGTANEIIASLAPGVQPSTVQLFGLIPSLSNSSSVRLSVGGEYLPVLDNAGNEIPAAGLIAGKLYPLVFRGTEYRLLFPLDVMDLADSAAASAITSAAAAATAVSAASSLLFRVVPSVEDAEELNIPETASFLAVAEFSPQPRFYKRFETDPGSGDRFVSADGAYWQGLPLPSQTLDFANAVERTGGVTVGSGDLNLVHRFTLSSKTVYSCTLPDPASYVGSMIALVIAKSSIGLLEIVTTTNPVGNYTSGGLRLWAGESIVLMARSDHWEIVGGRCLPCTLFATCPGSAIGMLDSGHSFNTEWVTAQTAAAHPGSQFAIDTNGQIVTPRQGHYHLEFDCGYAWTGSPSTLYAVAHSVATNVNRVLSTLPASEADILHATYSDDFAAGAAIVPYTATTGGAGIYVNRNTISPPQLRMIEVARW